MIIRLERAYCLDGFFTLMFSNLLLFIHLVFGFLLLGKLFLEIHYHFGLLSLKLNHFLDIPVNRRLFAQLTRFQCILGLHSDLLKAVFLGWDASLVDTFAQTKINRLFLIQIRCPSLLFLILNKRSLVVDEFFFEVFGVRIDISVRVNGGITRLGQAVYLMPIFKVAFFRQFIHLRLVGVIHGIVIRTLPITVITRSIKALVHLLTA